MPILLFSIAICTSIIGSICGIGGGVIIKPAIDAMGIMSVSAVSFLSGCTVLSMSVVSVLRSVRSGSMRADARTAVLVSIGAVVGGLVGRQIFGAVRSSFGSEEAVGLAQSVLLAAITALTLVYVRCDRAGRVRRLHITSPAVCAAVGLALGGASSFLGIGGGPINIAAISYLFSMDSKQAANCSLCVILFSQTASLIRSLVSGAVPPFDPAYLAMMCAGAIAGALIGQRINRRITPAQVLKLFEALLVAVMAVCVCNAIRFAA